MTWTRPWFRISRERSTRRVLGAVSGAGGARHAILYPHKPGQPWISYRHVGARVRHKGDFVYHIYRDHADVSLAIHAGKGKVEECNCLFDWLVDRHKQIEEIFGDCLEWDRRTCSDISFIRFNLYTGGLPDEDRWREMTEEMLDTMERLQEVLLPAVKAAPAPG